MIEDAPLFRAWRDDQIAAGPTFPEAGYRPTVERFDDYDYLWTPYDILGSGTALGWPICQVFYHGRSRTWCCGCAEGMLGLRPCRHVAGVLWWVELDRLRRGYLELSDGELLETWGWEAAAARAIGSGLVRAPHNWRIAPAALFDALCRRGLAAGVRDGDPVRELVAQAERVAA